MVQNGSVTAARLAALGELENGTVAFSPAKISFYLIILNYLVTVQVTKQQVGGILQMSSSHLLQCPEKLTLETCFSGNIRYKSLYLLTNVIVQLIR